MIWLDIFTARGLARFLVTVHLAEYGATRLADDPLATWSENGRGPTANGASTPRNRLIEIEVRSEFPRITRTA